MIYDFALHRRNCALSTPLTGADKFAQRYAAACCESPLGTDGELQQRETPAERVTTQVLQLKLEW
jgi:hypothetical protein